MPKSSDGKPISIRWQTDLCTACMSCMAVCAERHTWTGAPSRARIRIHSDVFRAEIVADYCRQCRNAQCASACPEEAIRFDNKVRAWLVDGDLCTACGLCVEACPFNAMWLDQELDHATKCDLCMGETRCVSTCPSGALTVRGLWEES